MNRLVRLRLISRDLSAGAAFAAIALSGSVPLWAMGVFLVGWCLALLNQRLLARRVVGAAVALSLGGLLLFGSAFRGGLDLVVAACTFAALVTLHRLLSTPDPTTDKQVHLSCLLMVSGGAALSGDWYFGLCLAAFLVLASLSLGLGMLEEFAPPPDMPLQPVVRQLSLGALAAIVGAIVFFVAFPRLSWNVASRRTPPGLGPATTGFSDRVRLGGGGSIKTNPRTVLRVMLSPDPGIERLDTYWLGRTFDTFTGREWMGTATAKPAALMVTLGAHDGEIVRQTIEVLPAYDSRTLVAMETPVSFSNAVARTPGGSGATALIQVPGEEIRVGGERPMALRYQAFSRPGGAAVLHHEGVDIDGYVQLPPNLDTRVSALARQIIGEEQDPLAAARRVQAYLQRNYEYTLELGEDTEDPLASFLFVRKAGHCEHFATALTVLLRTQGIPTRVAAGFFGGERIGDTYVIRAGDAHAWAQVLIPGRGFVTFDATPEANRAGQPLAAVEVLARAFEWIEGMWRRQVLDYSLEDQVGLVRTWVRPPSGAQTSSFSWSPNRRSLLLLILLALAGYLIWRLWGSRQAPKAHRATRLLERLERILRSAGITLEADETPQMLRTRLEAQSHPLAPALGKALRAYLSARFGAQPLTPTGEDKVVSEFAKAARQYAARSDQEIA